MSKTVRVTVKETCYRVIPSKYPTVELFDGVADSEDFDALYQLQALTNPRLLSSLPTNNNFIQSPFVHLNPEGSRFSNGSFGVFYAGMTEAVAIAETKYHREKFMLETNEPGQEIDMRMIVASLDAKLHNLSRKEKVYPSYYCDSDYSHSQGFGNTIYRNNHDGIRYSSVRHKEHDDAYAVFKQDVLSRARQSKHLVYAWDGALISSVYEKSFIDS